MNEINVRKNIREKEQSARARVTHARWPISDLLCALFFGTPIFHISYRCLSCELNYEALISKCVSNTHIDQCNRAAENDVFFHVDKIVIANAMTNKLPSAWAHTKTQNFELGRSPKRSVDRKKSAARRRLWRDVVITAKQRRRHHLLEVWKKNNCNVSFEFDCSRASFVCFNFKDFSLAVSFSRAFGSSFSHIFFHFGALRRRARLGKKNIIMKHKYWVAVAGSSEQQDKIQQMIDCL